MAGQERSEDQLARWAAALEKNGDNISVAARDLGIRRQTLQSAIPSIRLYQKAKPAEDVTLPDFPDDDIPTDELIDTLAKRFRKKKASFAAHKSMPTRSSSMTTTMRPVSTRNGSAVK